ncbi:MAG: YceI family protein [Mycobacteriaceae bacterium]|nr:YceI family protein [Mycobacteriaceae bacterium]
MSTVTDLLNSTAAVGTWSLDANRSSFSFTSKTMWGLANVKGHFTEFTGEGNLDAGGKVTGRVDVKAESVTTGIKRRDNHLRSADFFDAEHYPDITVTVTGADSAGDNEVNVQANLSIRGNTLAMPLRAKAEVLAGGEVRLTTTTTVDRERLGVSGNLVGMIPKTTTLFADAVFRRTGG